MKRKEFLGTIVPGAIALKSAGIEKRPAPKQCGQALPGLLAGRTLSDLRQKLHHELFDEFLPFWDKYGIDHENGGFMCGIDHDGTRVHSDKFHWFQGRGVWLYSFLFNHFGRNPRYLEIARKTKDFMLAHFPQSDGGWAELVSRDGKVITPFRGDPFGMYFAAEGLYEYAHATGDLASRDIGVKLQKKLFAIMNRPDYRDLGIGAPGCRPQGLWMANMQLSTQFLNRWQDPEISRIADQCVDAIIYRHWNPDLRLNNEIIHFDFSRVEGEEMRSLIGHAIECLWMVMDEAVRRNDQPLFTLAAERIRRHFEVGWDPVFGGLLQCVNVDQGCYEWPPEKPAGTTMEFRFRGEYQYVKSMWSMDEVLLSMMKVLEHIGTDWAPLYFTRTQQLVDEKYSLKPHGYPLWLTFADRRFTFQPHTMRKENYHKPRQLVFNILALDRMIQRGGTVWGK